jgi:formimidoylglutamate deiminase
MSHVFAHRALLDSGWSADVRIGVRDGRIATLEAGTTAAGGDLVADVVIPGLCNAHSHAFQRALAGFAEERSPAGCDSFWTWRERMYALASVIDAESLRAIAQQAYCEMLEAGYTAVAEFHYLHSEPSGGNGARMFEAVAMAAEVTGIRLAYVPVLYERGGFDEAAPVGRQRRFAMTAERFIAHWQAAREARSPRLGVGIGAHSLRAVSPESLARIASTAREAGVSMHIHVAEQQREVDQCLASTGRRPVRWLLENHAVDESWCLVHATHMDREEVESLAASGAVVCLCPSTEANLGDGLFPLADYLRAGGAIAIGSDSHVSINPFEELRWLEYGQRLAAGARIVAAVDSVHVGRELFGRALAGGAQATGQRQPGLAIGAEADLVTLDADDPMLVGHGDESLLDALVFSGYRLPIDRVMVHGDWRVVAGNHVDRTALRAGFAAAVRGLGQWQ